MGTAAYLYLSKSREAQPQCSCGAARERCRRGGAGRHPQGARAGVHNEGPDGGAGEGESGGEQAEPRRQRHREGMEQTLMRRGPFLSKRLLIQWLLLEETITISTVRLVLFALMFVLLYWASSLGVAQADKLRIATMIHAELQLDTLGDITLIGTRTSFLPVLSKLTKALSPSSSACFFNPNALQLLFEEQDFITPETVPGLALPSLA